MNAPARLARLQTAADHGLTLRLRTLTPLYTGGIGQLGDQIHPSNLLGGLRHMSCLLARTLGDGDFESRVWGNAGGGGTSARAKQVSLHWDCQQLRSVQLPGMIRVPREGATDSRWWFNRAFEGKLTLRITRLGIVDPDRNLLLLALAIQLRHATFGAKDQFGLGVLAPLDSTPFCSPLAQDEVKPAITREPGQLNLLRYAFGTLRFRAAIGDQRPILNHATALQLGLATRATLRNALRAKNDAPKAEHERLTELRHRMLGKLNQYGSAVNVSAAYGADENPELRIVVALKPQQSTERTAVMKAFSSAVTQNLDGVIPDTARYKTDGKVLWEYGGGQANTKIQWINTLAGVSTS